MKNVLLIIPNMDFGGAQRSFSKLSIGLAEKYQVTNVVFNAADGLAYPLGGNLLSLDIVASNSVWGKVFNFYKRISKIRKIKKAYNIEVSISFLEGADFINVLSRRSERIILSIRGSKQSDETIRGVIGWLRRKVLIPLLYRRADAITVVNHGIVYELDHFYGLAPVMKKVIYNYYDLDAITEMADEDLPAAYHAIADKPYLVFSGRLAPEKGIDKLLLAYSGMKTKHQYRFVIVGSGPMKASLERLCTELNFKFSDEYKEDVNVIFVGEQKNPHTFVRRARVFLMGSSSEGFPNGLVEAMACQTAVISTDCPWGPREILSQVGLTSLPEYANYGILLPMLNSSGEALDQAVQLWSKTLDTVVVDEEFCKQYGIKGFTRARQFDREAHFRHWIECIEHSEQARKNVRKS